MGFEEIRERVERHAGETFYQLGGKTFCYQVDGVSLLPSTAEQGIPRGTFEPVHALGAIPGPRRLREMGIQDGAFIFSILTDPRIARRERSGGTGSA